MGSQVLDWLLDESNPSVRYLTLNTLMDNPLDDHLVQASRKSIMKIGVVPKILSKQNMDGSWGIPERFYLDKYKGTVWTLLVLAELLADPQNQQIQKACDWVLEHSLEPASGGFSYQMSTITRTGLPGSLLPCLTGNMVFALVRLGYLDDERVQKAIDWICQYQRADDGLDQPSVDKKHERLTNCWGRHSCHMGVAKTLKALAAIPEDQRSVRVQEKLTLLTEYFLIHHVYKKSHHLEEVCKPGWLKFGFPLMYQTDILELLEIFADLKIRDPRLDEAIQVVAGKISEDDRWKLENSYNGRMWVSIEKKGQPSKWITWKALRILKEYRYPEFERIVSS